MLSLVQEMRLVMLQVEQVTFLGLVWTTGIATRSASKVEGIFGDDWNEKRNVHVQCCGITAQVSYE